MESGFDPQQVEEIFFFSSEYPDWLWGQSRFLHSGYGELSPQEQSTWGMKLTTDLHIVLRLTICGAPPPLLHMSSWGDII
jgi:hypothetical protein